MIYKKDNFYQLNASKTLKLIYKLEQAIKCLIYCPKTNADRESLEIDNKDDFFQFVPINFFFQL